MSCYVRKETDSRHTPGKLSLVPYHKFIPNPVSWRRGYPIWDSRSPFSKKVTLKSYNATSWPNSLLGTITLRPHENCKDGKEDHFSDETNKQANSRKERSALGLLL